ncbi:MAG: hypothetical protein ABSG27_15155, partial [Candidatus Acidiferrales bacterium]
VELSGEYAFFVTLPDHPSLARYAFAAADCADEGLRDVTMIAQALSSICPIRLTSAHFPQGRRYRSWLAGPKFATFL